MNKETADEVAHIQVNFIFTCPHCEQRLEAEPDMAGMELDCPTCGQTITVPPPTVVTSDTVPVDLITSAGPQSEIPTCSKGEEEALPPSPIISVVKKGEGNSERKRTWLIPVTIGAAMFLIVSLLIARPKSKEVDAQKTIPESSGSYSTKTLTPRERKAIGKILYTLGNVEANKDKFTKELKTTTGGEASEILMSVAGRVMADYLEKEEGWDDCPYEFQRAIKRAYVAMGKSAISATIEKYGKTTVMDTLKQYKVHANFTKYFIEVLDDNAASIAKELKDAQSQMQDCLAKYGIDGDNIMSLAVEEFAEQRMSACGLCKEFVQFKTDCKYTQVDDHTVMWDPGGENPPMICVVSFEDNGTLTVIQDNTFFALEYKGVSGYAVARKLEQAFPMANQYSADIKNIHGVSATLKDGHLYFQGKISVSPGEVYQKFSNLFSALNYTRFWLRFNDSQYKSPFESF